MMDPKIRQALSDFVRAAKGRSQAEMIVTFLDAVINAEYIIDSGSVLVNNPISKKLILFNEGEFLFRKNLLGSSGSNWPLEFQYFQGVAGLCFRTRTIQLFDKSRPQHNMDLIGNSPIENMVCIPITTTGPEPFGVACFHNNIDSKKFGADLINELEVLVDILSVALHTPHPELQIEKNIFIVHGRDIESKRDLENILLRNGANPKVLVDEEKNAQVILLALENLMKICKAGFVLVTPDDEARLVGSDGPFIPRARENVIFEMGLLFARYRAFERVAILLQEPLTLPSDLAGVTYEAFTQISDIETKIVEKLKRWGIRD